LTFATVTEWWQCSQATLAMVARQFFVGLALRVTDRETASDAQ
jgi:hypothetical protein